jgi:hypothetical protein
MSQIQKLSMGQLIAANGGIVRASWNPKVQELSQAARILANRRGECLPGNLTKAQATLALNSYTTLRPHQREVRGRVLVIRMGGAY